MTLWREFRAGGGSTLMLSLAGTLLLAGALWFAILPSSMAVVPGWGPPAGLLSPLLLAAASLLLLLSFLGRSATVMALLAVTLAALVLPFHPQLRPLVPFGSAAVLPVSFDAILRPLAAAGVLAFLAAWRLRAPAASPLAALPLLLLALLLLSALPEEALTGGRLASGPLPLLFLWSSFLLALLPWRGAALYLLPLAGLALLASPLLAARGLPFFFAERHFAFAAPENWLFREIHFSVTIASFLARLLWRRWRPAQKPT